MNDERDREMLRLVLEGYTQKQVARMLGVTQARVHKVVTRLDPDAAKKSYQARRARLAKA